MLPAPLLKYLCSSGIIGSFLPLEALPESYLASYHTKFLYGYCMNLEYLGSRQVISVGSGLEDWLLNENLKGSSVHRPLMYIHKCLVDLPYDKGCLRKSHGGQISSTSHPPVPGRGGPHLIFMLYPSNIYGQNTISNGHLLPCVGEP